MGKETILAVDDEPANLRMLERLFHRDYKVLTANGGEEALELFRREKVALILTDQRMPGMTGAQFLEKSLLIDPGAAKIILTGYTDVEALIEAINTSRVYKYVSKPWDPVELKQIVRNALGEYRNRLEQSDLVDSLRALVRSQIPSLSSTAVPEAENSAHLEHQRLAQGLTEVVHAHPSLFGLDDLAKSGLQADCIGSNGGHGG